MANKRILVAGPEEHGRQLLRTTLSTHDVTVVDHPIHLLADAPPDADLFILDATTTATQSALDVARALRQSANMRHVPIVLLARDVNVADRMALEVEAHVHVFAKPFSPLDLMRTVRGLL